MKTKILLILAAIVMALLTAACGGGGSSTDKQNVEKYREKVREQRQNNTSQYSDQNRKDVQKAIFPNIKDSSQ